jgi:hypothetical protein
MEVDRKVIEVDKKVNSETSFLSYHHNDNKTKSVNLNYRITMPINLKFSHLLKRYKWNTIWYVHLISMDTVTNKLELTCIIRIDGYRDSSKKIV